MHINVFKMKEDLFNDVIVKSLKGVATPHEKRMLSTWLSEDADREELFYYHLSKLESENPQYLPALDVKIEAYEKFLRGEVAGRKLQFPGAAAQKCCSSPLVGLRWWWAASVIVLISAAFYLLSDSIFYRTYSANNGVIKTVALEDGSKVTLNANSSITVPRDFMGDQSREVWIHGEAFFEVARKRNLMRFIVHTDNFDVEVLGTKFNINNRHCKSEVILAEGKLKLLAKDQKPLIMKPGEQVSLSNKQATFQKEMVKPEKYEAWRNNMLVFENTPLAEVTQMIEDHYGVKIILADSLLAKREFTGTLPNNDLNVILLALSTSYQIQVERKGNHIFLKNPNTINN
jgi:transmembrane sensor